MLAAVTVELARAGALVTFNGKSFDAPVIETRYLFHRLEWTGAGLPHVDVLHPARRFWGSGSSPRRAASSSEEPGCSLVSLERQILGAKRNGDVPGFEIPARYFQFVRSGDARPLEAVLEHNRLDLLSLAGLTARLLEVVQTGPDAAHDAREALALGVLYARGGHDARALDALQRAVEMSEPGDLQSREPSCAGARAAPGAEVRGGGGLLAPPSRRARRVRRRAHGKPNEALAIHHEHRLRDLVDGENVCAAEPGTGSPSGLAPGRAVSACEN